MFAGECPPSPRGHDQSPLSEVKRPSFRLAVPIELADEGWSATVLPAATRSLRMAFRIAGPAAMTAAAIAAALIVAVVVPVTAAAAALVPTVIVVIA